MRFLAKFGVALAASVLFSTASMSLATEGERQSAQVLYTGHSLMDNPLPEYIELIARSLGKEIGWEEQIVIGSPLRVRTWGDGGWAGYSYGKNRRGDGMNVVEEFRNPKRLAQGRRYDTLVATEGHSVIGTVIWENSVGYLRNFHDRLVDGNPKARTLYYHVWLGVDKANPEPWIRHERNASLVFQCVARKVQLTLEAEERPARLSVLPGGTAMVELVEHALKGEVPGISGTVQQKLDRIFRDDVHLTDLGIYFMAAVQYASIYHASPIGAKAPPVVRPETAKALQTIAWSHVREFEAKTDLGSLTMEDCREGIAKNACESYWTMKGEGGEVGRCRDYFANARPEADGNPFVWPDPNWKPLAYPAGQ